MNIRLSQNEQAVLAVLVEGIDSSHFYQGDVLYYNFKAIAQRAKNLPPDKVRRTVRSLARKGLAEFGKGLWTDEGMYGSGYCCTKLGCDTHHSLQDKQ